MDKYINKIIQGDCLEKLKELSDNSVDSICTDPPYELGFMGKSWDSTGVANNVEMWGECLRVLKPGGYLLSFGGTRTYHRMACAIEDAGFEVRDMICWTYGQGFPKSLNVRLNIDKQYDILKDIWLKSNVLIAPEFSIVAHHISSGEFFAIEPVAPSSQTQEQNVKYVVKNSSKRTAKSKIQGITIAEECVKDLLKESLVDKIKGEEAQKTLLGKWLSSKETDINANFAELIENLKHTILKKLEKLPNYDTNFQMDYVFVINATTTESIKECLITNTVNILKELNYKLHNGIGTALKPSIEPICMARKPLIEKTVAENVLKYGTGGINIDESRVGTEAITVNRHSGYNSNSLIESTKGKWKGEQEQVSGRFPANLIHDNSEEVRECFPETKSVKSQTTNERYLSGNDNTKQYGDGKLMYGKISPENTHSDSGNASRFFKSIIYQAKASKSERQKGCEELYWLNGKQIEKELWEKLNQENETNKDNKDFKRHSISRTNIHPTVKNVSLMSYLIKMVTPKGGIVLDPFAGSGSTLVAAKQNGFKYIGIELTEEYIPIIEARLNYTNPHFTFL